MSIVCVTGVSKKYFHYTSQWRRIASWFFPSLKSKEFHTIFQDITFSMQRGETIAIVGQNGAGKSTLLKMIVGIIPPTQGTIERHGKIAAILELGMGFSPELTGRENALHTASLMGYSFHEIEAVMDEIRDFAEIGDYFEEPIRIYSSGMQMRLAFAIATAFTPDLLIIDEALSVGDQYFQHKSFERIRTLKEQGTSLLFVSHDKSAIQSICDRAILIEQGRVIKDGDPEEVMDFYNALIADKENAQVEQITLENGKVQTISGSGEAKVQDIGLYNGRGEKVELVSVGDHVEMKIRVKVHQEIPELVLGFMIKDRLGQIVFGINSSDHGITYQNLQKDEVIDYLFKFNANIGEGSYSVATALALGKTHLEGNLEWRDLALVFDVVNTKQKHFIGTAWLDIETLSNRDMQ
ncbi:MAG: ABC transporter ATP-binding protein [Sulfuricurvum sp.]|nr:ABC transporter ATP-binding protein [Sulfuricurvum sp.]